MLFIHPACIEHLSPCCHRCLPTPPFNNSSFSPLVDPHHSRCMNRLGTPQCSDACIEFVCLYQIEPLCSSFEDLLFDRSTCRLSFQSLRNCFIICQRSSGCFSIIVVPALLLKHLVLDPFSTLLDLLRHHSLSQFLNPSRCSAQSHLAADGHPNCLAWNHHELLLVLSLLLSSLMLETRLSGPSSRWSWRFTRPDRRIPQHLCTSFECVPRQSLYFSMATRLVPSGMRLTTLDLMQHFVVNNRCSFDLSTRPTQTRFDPSTLQLACSHFVSVCNLRHDLLSKWHQR